MALFKKKKDYFFESFVELANYAKEAFLILEEGLKDFNASKAEELKNNVHLVEHKADLDKREIEEKLAKEFITPIDREDIFLLLDKIDDITDAIDEISYKLYIRNYDKLPSQINDFVAKSKEAILTMIELLQATGTAGAAAGQQPGMGGFWIMIVLMIVVLYFFMWRPESKRRKEMAKFREGLKKGDKIITAGGIYGTVKEVKDTTLLIEVDSNVTLRIDKNMVVADNSQLQK